jgi:hypothetical protein
MSLLELFCAVDDFMLSFALQWKAVQLATGQQRERAGQLWPSEVMTILIHFHQSLCWLLGTSVRRKRRISRTDVPSSQHSSPNSCVRYQT